MRICNTGVQKPPESARKLDLKAGPRETLFLDYHQTPIFILVVVAGICCLQVAKKPSIIVTDHSVADNDFYSRNSVATNIFPRKFPRTLKESDRIS